MYSTQIQPNSTEIQPFLSIFLSKKTHKKCFLQNSPIEMVTIKNPHWHIYLYCSGQTAVSRTNPEVQQQGGLAYNDISQISQFLLELNECWGRSQGYVNACQPSKPMGTNMSTTAQCPRCQLGIALNRARSDQSQIVGFVVWFTKRFVLMCSSQSKEEKN